MADNDFASQIASLDEAQLTALLNELGNRERLRFVMSDPGGDAPTVHRGAGFDRFNSLQSGSGLSDKEKLRQSAGRFSAFGQYKHYKRNKRDKKNRAEFEKAQNEEAARQRAVLGERRTMVQNQLRTVKMRKKIDMQFRDMELEGLFDRVVKQGLDQSVLGITRQHEDMTRESGFDTQARGLGGGSADADRIADIQSSQEQAIIKASARAQQERRGLSENLDRQRRSLLDSVSGSNPGEEARLSGELDNIRNQASSYGTQAANAISGMGISNTYAQNQSQAIGGLLSSYAKLYNSGGNTGGSY